MNMVSVVHLACMFAVFNEIVLYLIVIIYVYILSISYHIFTCEIVNLFVC